MLPGLNEQIRIIKKLKKINIILLKLLESMIDKPSFFFTKKKTSWCKCLLSGLRGENFLFNFLKIENKFSKHGYHINDI